MKKVILTLFVMAFEMKKLILNLCMLAGLLSGMASEAADKR